MEKRAFAKGIVGPASQACVAVFSWKQHPRKHISFFQDPSGIQQCRLSMQPNGDYENRNNRAQW